MQKQDIGRGLVMGDERNEEGSHFSSCMPDLWQSYTASYGPYLGQAETSPPHGRSTRSDAAAREPGSP